METEHWYRGVNESDLDKTLRPWSEAVEPREQRDSVVLCQTVSLSPSGQRSLSLQTFISSLSLSLARAGARALALSLTFIYICLPLFGLLRRRFHRPPAIICIHASPPIDLAASSNNRQKPGQPDRAPTSGLAISSDMDES